MVRVSVSTRHDLPSMIFERRGSKLSRIMFEGKQSNQVATKGRGAATARTGGCACGSLPMRVRLAFARGRAAP